MVDTIVATEFCHQTRRVATLLEHARVTGESVVLERQVHRQRRHGHAPAKVVHAGYGAPIV
jgi:hypothetical protein